MQKIVIQGIVPLLFIKIFSRALVSSVIKLYPQILNYTAKAVSWQVMDTWSSAVRAQESHLHYKSIKWPSRISRWLLTSAFVRKARHLLSLLEGWFLRAKCVLHFEPHSSSALAHIPGEQDPALTFLQNADTFETGHSSWRLVFWMLRWS